MNEVLLALAEEIRQTLAWLGREDEPPAASNIRFRLRTLREAAAMAHMNAVESVLAELETNLVDQDNLDQASESGGLEEVLSRLTGLIVSLSEPAEARQMEWVDQIGRVQGSLHKLEGELSQGADYIGQLTLGCDRAALADSEDERTSILIDLARNLRTQVDQARRWRYQVSTTSDLLSQLTKGLMREISAVHRIPLDPTLARLRERVRRYGRVNSRPVALQCRAVRLDVGAAQIETLGHILDGLFDGILNEGLLEPAQRRTLGLPTVATIQLEASRLGSLLTVKIKDDGKTRPGGPNLSNDTQKALDDIRGRLLWDSQEEQGQGLTLQIPLWSSSLEVLPVKTAVGQLMVPLEVVDRIHNNPDDTAEPMALLQLERRAASQVGPDESQGLVCTLNSWFGFLPGQVTGPAARVSMRPATSVDPAWAIGKVSSSDTDLPVFHPLPFLQTDEGWQCLYPKEGES